MRRVYKHITLALTLLLYAVVTFSQTSTISTDTFVLKEVTILNRAAFYNKGDTMVYTADSFINKKNAVLQDVFKKMPGIEVSASGKIYVHGKEITGVYINGVEATLSDIRDLTQNFPAEIIDKILISELYSEANRLTGSKDDPQGKIVNIQLKKDIEDGLYGKAIAGYGTESRYNANNFANYLSEKTRMTSVGYITNTGSTNVYEDRMSGARLGNITMKHFDLNFDIQDIGKKTKINGTYDYGGNSGSIQESRLRQTNFGGDTLQMLNHKANKRDNNNSHRFSANVKTDFDTVTSLSSTVSVYYNKSSNRTDDSDSIYYSSGEPGLYRTGNIRTDNESSSASLSSAFKHRWPGTQRSLLVRDDVTFGKNGTNAYKAYTDHSLNTITQNNTVQNKNTFSNNLYLQYSEPLNNTNRIIIDYSFMTNTSDDSNNVTVTDQDGAFSIDTLQTYHNNYRAYTHTGNLKHLYTTKKLSATTGVKVQSVSRALTGNEARYLNDSRTNICPLVSLNYMLENKSSINLNYTGNFQQPGLKQVIPVPDYRDSLNIYIGNSSLRPEFSNAINAGVVFSRKKNQNYAWLNASYTTVSNKIVNNVTLVDNKRYTSPVNRGGNYNTSLSAGYRLDITPKLKSVLNFVGTTGRNITVTNSVEQVITNILYKPSGKLMYTSEIADADVIYTYSLTRNNNSSQLAARSNSITAHSLIADIRIRLWWDISIEAMGTYTVNSGYLSNNQNFLFANAFIAKEFKNIPGLSLRLQAFDIFNNAPNLQRTVYDNYIEDSQSNRVGRYLLLSVAYKYNTY